MADWLESTVGNVIPLEERLRRHVRYSPSGCWEWTGCAWQGYGRISVICADGKKRPRAAYRVAYEHFVGPVPDGMDLDHLCRNPPCINPEHLEPVTHRENILRGEAPSAMHAKKTHCPQGHPYSGDNLAFQKGRYGVQRRCRICKRASDARYKRSR